MCSINSGGCYNAVVLARERSRFRGRLVVGGLKACLEDYLMIFMVSWLAREIWPTQHLRSVFMATVVLQYVLSIAIVQLRYRAVLIKT